MAPATLATAASVRTDLGAQNGSTAWTETLVNIGDMKRLRVSQDIVPVGEFKGHASRWLRRASESGQPVVITQNGRPAGVLVSAAEFDRLVERQEFLESVAAGITDADAGRTMDSAELRHRLAARRAHRPSS
jgi:prevent-host-death family protein